MLQIEQMCLNLGLYKNVAKCSGVVYKMLFFLYKIDPTLSVLQNNFLVRSIRETLCSINGKGFDVLQP